MSLNFTLLQLTTGTSNPIDMDHHHGDMDMGDGSTMCSMNMLFTWSTENLCIVFPQWRVTGFVSLITSLVAVVALTAGYEAVRAASRRYEAKETARVEQMGRKCSELLGVEYQLKATKQPPPPNAAHSS